MIYNDYIEVLSNETFSKLNKEYNQNFSNVFINNILGVRKNNCILNKDIQLEKKENKKQHDNQNINNNQNNNNIIPIINLLNEISQKSTNAKIIFYTTNLLEYFKYLIKDENNLNNLQFKNKLTNSKDNNSHLKQTQDKSFRYNFNHTNLIKAFYSQLPNILSNIYENKKLFFQTICLIDEMNSFM